MYVYVKANSGEQVRDASTFMGYIHYICIYKYIHIYKTRFSASGLSPIGRGDLGCLTNSARCAFVFPFTKIPGNFVDH